VAGDSHAPPLSQLGDGGIGGMIDDDVGRPAHDTCAHAINRQDPAVGSTQSHISRRRHERVKIYSVAART
jgi:hypothetical protein